MKSSKIGTIIFSAGNVFIALALIALVYMTRRNMPKIYATYSMMTGLLSTIAVGILLLLIVSVIIITIISWFPDDRKEEHHLLEEDRVDHHLDRKLATFLKSLSGIEGALYIMVNIRLLYNWVVLGKLKTLVNKFLGLNRLYGLIFVAVLITHTLAAPQTIFPQHRTVYCYLFDFTTYYFSFSFWSNNIVIALIRVSLIIPLVVTILFMMTKLALAVESHSMQFCLNYEVGGEKAEKGIQYTFVFLFPMALFIYPTVTIYILLINYNNRRGVRQKNRTNLLTARQSKVAKWLSQVIMGGTTTFVNVIYPVVKERNPEIILLLAVFVTMAGILVETGETHVSCMENDPSPSSSSSSSSASSMHQ